MNGLPTMGPLNICVSHATTESGFSVVLHLVRAYDERKFIMENVMAGRFQCGFVQCVDHIIHSCVDMSATLRWAIRSNTTLLTRCNEPQPQLTENDVNYVRQTFPLDR